MPPRRQDGDKFARDTPRVFGAAHTTGEARMDPALMVIVPHHLPARAATLNEALAGTNIQVVMDRRHGERRRTHQPADVQRRQGDRRGAARVVAYVYACPVVAVGSP